MAGKKAREYVGELYPEEEIAEVENQRRVITEAAIDPDASPATIGRRAGVDPSYPQYVLKRISKERFEEYREDIEEEQFDLAMPVVRRRDIAESVEHTAVPNKTNIFVFADSDEETVKEIIEKYA